MFTDTATFNMDMPTDSVAEQLTNLLSTRVHLLSERVGVRE